MDAGNGTKAAVKNTGQVVEDVASIQRGSTYGMTGQVILTRFGLAWKSHMMFLHAIKKQLCSTTRQKKKADQHHVLYVFVAFRYL